MQKQELYGDNKKVWMIQGNENRVKIKRVNVKLKRTLIDASTSSFPTLQWATGPLCHSLKHDYPSAVVTRVFRRVVHS